MKLTRSLRLPRHLRSHSGCSRSGFSLAELMVVIVIIALLATLVVTNAPKFLSTSYKSKLKSDIMAIEGAVDNFLIETGKYPESLEALVQPDANGDTYLKGERIPMDPWKNEYIYEPPSGAQKKPIIRSLGRDGQPGGEGDDMDVDNVLIRNNEY